MSELSDWRTSFPYDEVSTPTERLPFDEEPREPQQYNLTSEDKLFRDSIIIGAILGITDVVFRIIS